MDHSAYIQEHECIQERPVCIFFLSGSFQEWNGKTDGCQRSFFHETFLECYFSSHSLTHSKHQRGNRYSISDNYIFLSTSSSSSTLLWKFKSFYLLNETFLETKKLRRSMKDKKNYYIMSIKKCDIFIWRISYC